jgi:hypothetical protein
MTFNWRTGHLSKLAHTRAVKRFRCCLTKNRPAIAERLKKINSLLLCTTQAKNNARTIATLNQSPPGSNSGGFWRLNPWGRYGQKYLRGIEQPPTSTQPPNGGLIMDREKTDLLTEIDQLEGKSERRPEQSKGLDKKVEIGFANIDTKFAKLEGKIDTVEAKLEGKIDKLDERTKLGFWGFIFRGTTLAALAALTTIFVKYLFPILPTAIQK